MIQKFFQIVKRRFLTRNFSTNYRFRWVRVVERPKLVTVSYAGDIHYFVDLRNSAVKQNIHLEHLVIVDPWEVETFKKVCDGGVKIIETPDVVPRDFWKWWMRNKNNKKAGYVKQQVVKISAAAYLGHAHTLIVDSDFIFVRALGARKVLRDLGKITGDFAFAKECRWLTTAGRIAKAYNYFQLPTSGVGLLDYTSPFQLLIRDVTLGMIQQIQKYEGKAWWNPIISSPHTTEYALYQAFGREVADPQLKDDVGIISINSSPWYKKDLNQIRLEVRENPEVCGLVLQSTLGESGSIRQRICAGMDI